MAVTVCKCNRAESYIRASLTSTARVQTRALSCALQHSVNVSTVGFCLCRIGARTRTPQNSSPIAMHLIKHAESFSHPRAHTFETFVRSRVDHDSATIQPPRTLINSKTIEARKFGDSSGPTGRNVTHFSPFRPLPFPNTSGNQYQSWAEF